MPSSSHEEVEGIAVPDLISQPESKDLGFEAEIPEVDDAAQLIAGIANSGGGTIVLGAEGEGEVPGLGDPEHAQAVVSEAADSIVPQVSLDFAAETVEGRQVGVVTVQPSEGLSQPPKGPITRRDESGQARVVTKDEIFKALPKATARDPLEELAEQMATLNERFAKSEERAKQAFAEAKSARSLKGQAPGVIGGALLGAVLGAIATGIFG